MTNLQTTVCTREDVQNIVENVVTERDSELFWRLLRWLGIPLMLLTFALGGAWLQIQQNTEFRKEGGQFTLQQQDTFASEVDRRFEEQQTQILQLREDLNKTIMEQNKDIDQILNILLNRP